MNEAHQKPTETIKSVSEPTNSVSEPTNKVHPFTFSIVSQHPNLYQVIITVPAEFVDTLFDSAAKTQQQRVQPVGFTKNNVPLSYIKQNYRLNIVEHIKEFLFKFCVLNFLYNQIHDRKITMAGEPRLTHIELESGKDAFFYFDLTLANPIIIQEWKYFPFKAPRRKNYKDLDKQVENFILEESELYSKAVPNRVALHDWINITLHPVHNENENTSLFNSMAENFWFKMGDEDVESLLRELFFGKQDGDIFTTYNQGLQDYFSDSLNTNYCFKVEINAIVPHSYFCFDQFKNYFRIKSNKDMHKKLIEVFSYRNDISQRRAMVEESLALLLSKHKFDVPKHLILRQQNNILASIRQNPDYNVYRKQNDFNLRIEQLANRQAKEMVLVDQVAYHENINVSHEDIKGYLNLTKRNRMREFLYFDILDSKRNGQEIPIPTEVLKQTCLREKTVNHIIYNLTKK